MDLADILSKEQIITDLLATNRWEAIDELIDNLVTTGKIQSASREAPKSVRVGDKQVVADELHTAPQAPSNKMSGSSETRQAPRSSRSPLATEIP